MKIIKTIMMFWISLGAGFAVAAGFVAFICLIGIITRLASMTKTASRIRGYERATAFGLVAFNLLSLYPEKARQLVSLVLLNDSSVIERMLLNMARDTFMTIMGLFAGIFAGCLAGALAEVLNIIPILSRRLEIRREIPWVLGAVAVGKCIGTVLQCFIMYKKL